MPALLLRVKPYLPACAALLAGFALAAAVFALRRPAPAADPVARVMAAHPAWYVCPDPDGKGAYFSKEPRTRESLWLLPIGESRSSQWSGVVRVRIDPNREPPPGAEACPGGVWCFGDETMVREAAGALR